MFCKYCGKETPENSKFCRYCGKSLTNIGNKGTHVEHIVDEVTTGTINSNTHPYPYVISTSKLIILSLATFGIYEIYWFYKHFKSFKAEDGWKVTPWARALFAGIMSYSLFKHVSEKVNKLDKSEGLNAGGLAVLFFILNTLWKLPDPYWWLSMLTVLPLIPAQNAINYYWNQKYKGKVEESDFSTWNIVVVIIGGLVILLALYGTFLPE